MRRLFYFSQKMTSTQVLSPGRVNKGLITYKHVLCFSDTDECMEGIHDCPITFSDCINTEGSYNCSCRTGWSGDDGYNCSGKWEGEREDNK